MAPDIIQKECKVLGDFGTKYAKSVPTKDHRRISLPRKKLAGSNKTTTLLTI